MVFKKRDVCVVFSYSSARVAYLYYIEWWWLIFVLPNYVLKCSLYVVWHSYETFISQPCISQCCRSCTFYLVPDREMLRWYLTAFSSSSAEYGNGALASVFSKASFARARSAVKSSRVKIKNEECESGVMSFVT